MSRWPLSRRTGAAAGDSRIVLLLVMRDQCDLDPPLKARIRALLAREASSAHVPAIIAQVPELPSTHNGKRSERAARDTLNGGTGSRMSMHSETLNASRRSGSLLSLKAGARRRRWRATSHLRSRANLPRSGSSCSVSLPLTAHDNFFEIGGTSLLAVPLFQAVYDRLGRGLPLSTLITAPTIAALAEIVREEPGAVRSSLVLLKEGRPRRAALPRARCCRRCARARAAGRSHVDGTTCVWTPVARFG